MKRLVRPFVLVGLLAGALVAPAGALAASAPVNTAAPSISGSADVGRTLTANKGTWTGDPTPTYAYQWQRCTEGSTYDSSIFGSVGNEPLSIALDSNGNVYTADYAGGSGSTVSKLLPDGTPAGGNWPVSISSASDIYIDASDNIFVAGGSFFSKLTPSGTVTFTNLTGDSGARGIITDSSGNIYVASVGNDSVAKFNSAGNPAGGVWPVFLGDSQAPTDIAIDSSGNLFTSNEGGQNVSKITPSGTVTSFGNTGPAPQSLAIDSSGDILVPNFSSKLVKIAANGSSSTNVGDTGSLPREIVLDASNNAYTVNSGNASRNVTKITPAGVSSVIGNVGAIPYGLARDAAGNFYVANSGDDNVSKLSLALTCTDIPSATNPTYTLTATDEGKKIKVKVTATNTQGSANATSASTGTVGPEPSPAAPTNGTPPSVSGTAEVGSTLTADPGTWNGYPTPTIAYQWQRCEETGTPTVAGVDWTTRTSAADSLWRWVTWGGPAGQEKFVAVAQGGTGSRVMTSPDGINWTGRTAAVDNSWSSVTWGGSAGQEKFVAVSNSGTGNRVMTSPDGINWTTRTSAADNGWLSVTWGGPAGQEKFVAVAPTGSGNRVMTSPDGITWTARTSAADNNWNAVTWGGPAGQEKFVAVAASGSGNRVMTSPDGINWTGRTSAADNTWQSVTWGGPAGQEKFVAVASDGSGNRVMTSPDGINWTVQTYPADNSWLSVTWGGPSGQEKFVATASTGSGNRVMTSPDGVNWTIRTSAADNSWRSVTWGGPSGQEKFVAVSFTGTGNRVMTSESSSATTCSDIPSATNPTYTLAGADEGKKVRVKVTATNGAGSSNANSSPTATVDPAPIPVNTSPPTISGTPEVGETLTADKGIWSGAPTSYAYQWQRCEEGVVSSILGTTGAFPAYLALDSAGNVYTVNNTAKNVTKITPAGVSSTLGTTGNNPYSIAFDSSDNAYVTNNSANNVTKITPGGVSTVFGTTGTNPVDITVDSAGNVYTTNFGSNNVTKITPGGSSSVFGTTGTNPYGITLDSSGNAYVTNYGSNSVTKITSGGSSSILGSTGTQPISIVRDSAGNVYTANYGSDNVTKINSGGVPSVFANTGDGPYGIAIDPAGNLYTANLIADTVTKITPGGVSSVYATTGTDPRSIAIDDEGYIYTANAGSDNVSRIGPGLNCTDISGADDPTYTLTGDDKDKKVRVKVTATNAAGSGNANSAPTETVEGSSPANTDSPTVTGTAQKGQTLTADKGTWTGFPTPTYAYQWQRCTKVAGIDWQDYGNPGGVTNVNWEDVTYGEGLYVAVGSTGPDRVMTSPDGATWTVRDNPSIDGNNWESITYGGGQFVAVSSSGADRVMTSPDGTTWTLRSTAGDSLFLSSIAYGEGKFVAGSLLAPYSFMSSTDGVNWTVAGNAGAGPYGITYGDGKFVSVGYQINGTVGTSVSADGVNWTSNPAPVDIWWYGVTYANGKFVAVGSNIASDAQRIMTSPDGTTWTSATSAEVGGSWTSVDFGEGVFAAAAISSVRMWSGDGEEWQGNYGSYVNIKGMVFGDGRFVGVGGDLGTFSYATVSESDCTDISGADDPTYVPTSDDIGKRIRVKVTATNEAGTTESYSAPTDLVIPDVSTMTVDSTGATITSDPAGIDCGTECEFDFPYNAEVTLTATPEAGKNFDAANSNCPGNGWNKVDATSWECTVTMSQARTVSVAFQTPKTIWVGTGSTGGGSCESPDYNTVGAAEQNALPGDTIRICEGEFTGAESGKALTYEGEGAGKTIIGPGGTEGDDGFYVFGDGGVSSTFRNMTIRGAGRAISAFSQGGGPLTIQNVAFEENGASEGGAIFSSVAVNISGSTFSGNTAGVGSAVIAFGPVTALNSTFSGNGYAAPPQNFRETEERGVLGGSPSPDYWQGGVIVTLSIVGSEDLSDISLTNVTLAGNDSGLSASLTTLCFDEGPCPEGPEFPSGDIEVDNSIIAEEGAGCGTPNSGVIFGGGNVVQNTTTGCDSLVGGPPAPAGKVASSSIALQPLALNAPGDTETMALGSSSVARGAAVGANCPDTDQRGVARPVSACDAGAYQASTAPSGKPRLKVSVTSPKKVKAGRQFTVRVRTTNKAKAQGNRSTAASSPGTTAKRVKTCLKLPKGVVVVSSGGGKVQGRTVCWRRSSLAAGKSVTYRVKVRTVGSSSGMTTFRATASGSNAAGAKAKAKGKDRIKVEPKPQPKPEPPTG